MELTVAEVRSEADREKIFRFRYEVYVETLGLSPPSADRAGRRLWDPLDDASVSYALFEGDQVMGSLRVTFLDDVPDPEPLVDKFGMAPAIAAFGRSAICTTSRFILHPRLRHGKAIFRLMEAAYEHGMTRGCRLNYGDCSPHLLPFYEHLGYRRYTEAYNDTAYGFKVLILMVVRDRERFERVRSPMLAMVARHPDDPEARAWFAATYPRYGSVDSAAFLPSGVFFDLLHARVAGDPLHSVGLLHGLDRTEADRFLERATLIQAKPGDRIVREGEPGEALFVLVSGLAEVVVDGLERPLNLLGAGDTFGEIGVLTARPRTASVVATAPCEIVVLSAEFLHRFIAREPAIAAKVLLNLSRALADRLAVAHRQPGPRF